MSKKSREIALHEVSGATIEPYSGDVPDIAPAGFQSFEHHEWSVLRPPDTGKIQAQWSKLVTPVRALAIGFLWLTLYVWRFATAVLVIAMIVTLWRMS